MRLTSPLRLKVESEVIQLSLTREMMRQTELRRAEEWADCLIRNKYESPVQANHVDT